MAYVITHKGKERIVKVEKFQFGKYKVSVDDIDYLVDYAELSSNLSSVIVDGKSRLVDLGCLANGESYEVSINGEHFEFDILDEKKKKLSKKLSAALVGPQEIKSPMSGNVLNLMVKEGDEVLAGDLLLILEAMKMKNEIKSPVAGVVSLVSAKEGIPVTTNQLLCIVEPPV